MPGISSLPVSFFNYPSALLMVVAESPLIITVASTHHILQIDALQKYRGIILYKPTIKGLSFW